MGFTAILTPTPARGERERVDSGVAGRRDVGVTWTGLRGVEGAEGVVGVGFLGSLLLLEGGEGEVVGLGGEAEQRAGGFADGLGRRGGVVEQVGKLGEGVAAVAGGGAMEQRVLELEEDADLLAGVADDPPQLVGGDGVPLADVAGREPPVDKLADDQGPLVWAEAVGDHGGSPGGGVLHCTRQIRDVQ